MCVCYVLAYDSEHPRSSWSGHSPAGSADVMHSDLLTDWLDCPDLQAGRPLFAGPRQWGSDRQEQWMEAPDDHCPLDDILYRILI